MRKITKEEVRRDPWKYSANQWRYAHGVDIPHVGEISPMQYHYLSKAGKKRYDDKRNDDWTLSGESWQEWRDAVIEAHDAQSITKDSEGISSDARSLIIAVTIEREKEARAIERAGEIASARYHDIGELQKGDKVFMHTLRYWAEVKRVNKKTVTISHKFGDMKVLPTDLYRLDPRTI